MVKQILHIMDILLVPSYTESFCISALEAAAVGLSVTANDVGGVDDVLPESFITLSSGV